MTVLETRNCSWGRVAVFTALERMGIGEASCVKCPNQKCGRKVHFCPDNTNPFTGEIIAYQVEYNIEEPDNNYLWVTGDCENQSQGTLK